MKRPSAALVVASLALFVSLCGTGIAASHYLITSTKQISPGVLRRLEKAGPRGKRGATGATGAAGAAGVAGTFSAANVAIVNGPTVSYTSAFNGGNYSTATCPAGDTVIGGGYQGASGGAVYTDGSSGGSAWTVAIGPTSANIDGVVTGYGVGGQFYAQAVCAS